MNHIFPRSLPSPCFIFFRCHSLVHQRHWRAWNAWGPREKMVTFQGCHGPRVSTTVSMLWWTPEPIKMMEIQLFQSVFLTRKWRSSEGNRIIWLFEIFVWHGFIIGASASNKTCTPLAAAPLPVSFSPSQQWKALQIKQLQVLYGPGRSAVGWSWPWCTWICFT